MHDRFIGAVLPLVMVYSAFALALSVLHVSGVIAVVAAALTLNALHTHRKQPTDAQQRSDDFFEDFWGFIDTLANAALFFGIGVMVGGHEWRLPWILVPLACVALAVSRLATVYPMGSVFAALGRGLPRSWLYVLSASGLRGGLSVALLLSLPASYPHRTAMLCLAFALVVFSLVAHLVADRLWLRNAELTDAEPCSKGATQ
jgi:CPA1 family monovalent cation:H+ antiporter